MDTNENATMPTGSARSAFYQIILLYEILKDILSDFLPCEPTLNETETFECELRLAHRAMMSLSIATDAPMDLLTATGLRTSQRAWEDLPLTSVEAVEEIDRILQGMEPCLRSDRGLVTVSGFGRLLIRELAEVVDDLEHLYLRLAHGFELEEEEQDEPMDVIQGANDEQLNSMPIYVATDEDDDKECIICLDNFEAGEDMKILPCSHQFHKKCIDNWLKRSATCPADRSAVFSN